MGGNYQNKNKNQYNRKQNTIRRINKAESWFLVFSNKIGNKEECGQKSWMKNETSLNPTPTDIKMIKEIWTNSWNNFDHNIYRNHFSSPKIGTTAENLQCHSAEAK